MSITIHRHGDMWDVTRHCATQAEALAAAQALDQINPLAYMPASASEAVEAPTVARPVDSAPGLPPAIEALQERCMADDPHVGALKAGEAG